MEKVEGERVASNTPRFTKLDPKSFTKIIPSNWENLSYTFSRYKINSNIRTSFRWPIHYALYVEATWLWSSLELITPPWLTSFPRSNLNNFFSLFFSGHISLIVDLKSLGIILWKVAETTQDLSAANSDAILPPPRCKQKLFLTTSPRYRFPWLQSLSNT